MPRPFLFLKKDLIGPYVIGLSVNGNKEGFSINGNKVVAGAAITESIF